MDQKLEDSLENLTKESDADDRSDFDIGIEALHPEKIADLREAKDISNA